MRNDLAAFSSNIDLRDTSFCARRLDFRLLICVCIDNQLDPFEVCTCVCVSVCVCVCVVCVCVYTINYINS